MENINVVLRVRPLNTKEKSNKDLQAWQVTSQNTLQALPKIAQDQKLTKSSYQFDYCYRQEDDNESIYDNSVQKIVLSSLHGINGSIFMYGQTGSGKTFSMMGYNHNQNQGKNKQVYNIKKNQYDNRRDDGLLQNSLRDLFQNINADSERTYILKCQYIEIYNDQVYDLLQTPDKLKTPLQIAQDQNQRFYLKGIREISVSSQQEIFDTLAGGEINRHYASTRLNHKSSRSHVIFRLTVQSLTSKLIKKYRQHSKIGECNVNNTDLLKQLQAETKKSAGKDRGAVITESELNFVDLAGSEKVSIHDNIKDAEDNDVSNKRVNEGKHINKSLFFLTQIIQTRSKGKNHVPYRNSPLTKILKYSLEGNSRNLIICCISPAQSQIEQTVSTLRFGLSARQITNTIQINIQSKSSEEALGILLSGYERKIRDLGIQKENDKQRILYLKNQVEKLFNEKKSIKQQKGMMQQEFFQLFQEAKEKQSQLQDIQIENTSNQSNFITANNILPLQTQCDIDIQSQKQYAFANKMDLINRELNQNQELNILQMEKKSQQFSHLNNIGSIFLTSNNQTMTQKESEILQPGWQDLIFDFQGKFAFKAFQKAKNKCGNFQKAYMLVSEKCAKFMKKLGKDLQVMSENLDQYYQKNDMNLESFQEFYSHNVTELVHQCKQLEDININNCKKIHKIENEKGQLEVELNNTKKQFSLYQDFQGGQTLDMENLQQFEDQISKLLEQVKEERISRKFKKQIYELQNNKKEQKLNDSTDQSQSQTSINIEDNFERQFNNEILQIQQFQPIEYQFYEPNIESKYESYLNKIPQFQINEKIQTLEKTIRQVNQFSVEMHECNNMGKESEKKHIDLDKLDNDIVKKLKDKCNDIMVQELTNEKQWIQRRNELEQMNYENFEKVKQMMQDNKLKILEFEEQKKQQAQKIEQQQKLLQESNIFDIEKFKSIISNQQQPKQQIQQQNNNDGDITGRLSQYIGQSPKNNFKYFTQQDDEGDEEFDELQLQLDLQNIEKQPFTTEYDTLNPQSNDFNNYKFQADFLNSQSKYSNNSKFQSIENQEQSDDEEQEFSGEEIEQIQNQQQGDLNEYLQTFGTHTPVKYQQQESQTKSSSNKNLNSNSKHKKSSSVNIKADNENIYNYQTLQSASNQKGHNRNLSNSIDKKKPQVKNRSTSQYNSIDNDSLQNLSSKKKYTTVGISDKRQLKEIISNYQANKDLQDKISQKQQQLIQFNKTPLNQQNPNIDQIYSQNQKQFANQRTSSNGSKRSVSIVQQQKIEINNKNLNNLCGSVINSSGKRLHTTNDSENYKNQILNSKILNNENVNVQLSQQNKQDYYYNSANKKQQFQNFINERVLMSSKK